MILSSSITAVVTGGASGLGEGTARALAAQGVKVALFDMNAERGEQVASEIGGVFCKVDVTSDTEVEAGFAKARAAHGQERVLVNCAGIATGAKTVGRKKDTGEITTFPQEVFERTVRINLFGSFRCLSLSAKGMVALEPLEDGSGAASSTPPRSPRRTARSARRPIRRPRAGCWPWRCRSRAT